MAPSVTVPIVSSRQDTPSPRQSSPASPGPRVPPLPPSPGARRRNADAPGAPAVVVKPWGFFSVPMGGNGDMGIWGPFEMDPHFGWLIFIGKNDMHFWYCHIDRSFEHIGGMPHLKGDT